MTKYSVSSEAAPLTVACGVIRNTAGQWELIDDGNAAGGHSPISIDSVVTDSAGITINFTSAEGYQVGSFICNPDETLSQQGFFAGASVGATSAVIRLAQVGRGYNDYIAYTGGAWVSANGVFTDMSFNTSDGVLTVNHPEIKGPAKNFCQLTGREGTALNYTPNIAGISTYPTGLQLKFRNSAGAVVTTPDTNMRVFIAHGGGGTVAIDPTTVTTTLYPNSNIWLFAVMRAL